MRDVQQPRKETGRSCRGGGWSRVLQHALLQLQHQPLTLTLDTTLKAPSPSPSPSSCSHTAGPCSCQHLRLSPVLRHVLPQIHLRRHPHVQQHRRAHDRARPGGHAEGAAQRPPGPRRAHGAVRAVHDPRGFRGQDGRPGRVLPVLELRAGAGGVCAGAGAVRAGARVRRVQPPGRCEAGDPAAAGPWGRGLPGPCRRWSWRANGRRLHANRCGCRGCGGASTLWVSSPPQSLSNSSATSSTEPPTAVTELAAAVILSPVAFGWLPTIVAEPSIGRLTAHGCLPSTSCNVATLQDMKGRGLAQVPPPPRRRLTLSMARSPWLSGLFLTAGASFNRILQPTATGPNCFGKPLNCFWTRLGEGGKTGFQERLQSGCRRGANGTVRVPYPSHCTFRRRTSHRPEQTH